MLINIVFTILIMLILAMLYYNIWLFIDNKAYEYSTLILKIDKDYKNGIIKRDEYFEKIIQYAQKMIFYGKIRNCMMYFFLSNEKIKED